MERTIRLVLEMTVTGIMVVFLLTYLLRGDIRGRSGVWEGMQTIAIPVAGNMDMEFGNTDGNGAGQIPEVFLDGGQCVPNREYLLCELFPNSLQQTVYLKLEEVCMAQKPVLARGNLEELSQEENPAAALYDSAMDTLLFTRPGTYRVSLIVGTQYGRKPSRRVFMTVPVVSGEALME